MVVLVHGFHEVLLLGLLARWVHAVCMSSSFGRGCCAAMRRAVKFCKEKRRAADGQRRGVLGQGCFWREGA